MDSDSALSALALTVSLVFFIGASLGEASLAADMADRLLQEGIYVVGFSYPVVPVGQARIRTQLSAAHTFDQIDQAIAAFTKVGREMKVIPS